MKIGNVEIFSLVMVVMVFVIDKYGDLMCFVIVFLGNDFCFGVMEVLLVVMFMYFGLFIMEFMNNVKNGIFGTYTS